MNDTIDNFIQYCDTISIQTYNVANESIIFNKNDIHFNVDKFETGRSNVLLITGLSGSGKSTLANQYSSKYHAEIIELDIFEYNKSYSDENLKQAGEVFYKYFNETPEGKKFRALSLEGKRPTGNEFHKSLYHFIKYTLSFCKRSDIRYIVEGVQLYSHLSADEIKGYPLIITGTSMKNSILQRFKRNGNGKIEWTKELKNEFGNLLYWYWEEEKNLNRLKKEIN